jgi:hypothetical protein
MIELGLLFWERTKARLVSTKLADDLGNIAIPADRLDIWRQNIKHSRADGLTLLSMCQALEQRPAPSCIGYSIFVRCPLRVLPLRGGTAKMARANWRRALAESAERVP